MLMRIVLLSASSQNLYTSAEKQYAEITRSLGMPDLIINVCCGGGKIFADVFITKALIDP